LKKKNKLFYKKTGMFVDWSQLTRLPDIDIFIDIGFGPEGTSDLIKKFKKKFLILIDPLEESESYARLSLNKEKYTFFRCSVGSHNGVSKLYVQKELGNSSLLKATNINFQGKPFDERKVKIFTLDTIMRLWANKKKSNKVKKINQKIGIKIDTEGYELEVIKGAKETLKKTEFVLIEARHNHTSFYHQYKLSELMNLMSDNDFVLDMIITAKPFIADLCFVKIKNN
jgi:FkbM family methyltransferase